jgi:hypothetical protein
MVSSFSQRFNEFIRLLDRRELFIWIALAVGFLPLVVVRVLQNSWKLDTRLLWLFLTTTFLAFVLGWLPRFKPKFMPSSKRFYFVFCLATLCAILATVLSSLSLGIIGGGLFLASFSIRYYSDDTWLYSVTILTVFVILSLTPRNLEQTSQTTARQTAHLSSRILDALDVPNIVFDDLVVTEGKQIDVSGLSRGLEIELLAVSIVSSFLVYRARSLLITIFCIIVTPLLTFMLKTSTVLLVQWRGTLPNYFDSPFFSLYHLLSLLSFVVVIIAVVDCIRIICLAIPPPRIAGDSLLSVEAFNDVIGWPSSSQLKADKKTVAQMPSENASPISPPISPLPFSIMAMTFLSAVCGIAVLAMWFFEVNVLSSDASTLLRSRVTAVLNEKGLLVESTKHASDAVPVSNEFAIKSGDATRFLGLENFSSEYDFVSHYARKHQAIRVNPTYTFDVFSSDGEIASAANAEGTSYSWMLQGEVPCRTLLTVVVVSKSSKLIARRNVPPVPGWVTFSREWCWNEANGKQWCILHLAIDSQGRLNTLENQAERAKFGELVSAILEAKQ